MKIKVHFDKEYWVLFNSMKNQKFNNHTISSKTTHEFSDLFSIFSRWCLSRMQMRGLLVNFILVQFKEGLKIQSAHQNNKPRTPSLPPPPCYAKKRGDYINVYIFINHLGDSRPQNKEKLLVWVFLLQWVLPVGKGKEVDNSIEFNSILLTLTTTKYNIFYSKKKWNVQST